MPKSATQEPAKVLTAPGLAPTTLSDEQLGQAVAYLLVEAEKNGSPDAPFGEIKSLRKRAYLIALAMTGVKLRAAQVAGVSSRIMYGTEWQADEAFKAAEVRAQGMAADVLEAELYRRAVEGTVEPAGWYKGEAGGLVRKFSDVLLIFALKGALPDKYKDRLEFKGMVANIDLDRLSQAQLARLAAGESAISVLGAAVPVMLPAPENPADVATVAEVQATNENDEGQ